MERKRNITRFILKALPFIVIPPVLLTLLYWALDPFGALRRYDSFYDTDYSYNRGMVSVRTLNKNMEAGYNYNSFLLGSSMSLYYPADYWEKKLGNEAKAIHFDSSAQPITTLRRTVEYLDRKGISIDNAIVVLASETFKWEENNKTLPFVVPAEWRNDSKFPELSFQADMYKKFYDRQFLRTYIPWVLFGNTFDIEGKVGLEDSHVDYVIKHNEPRYSEAEKIIATAPEKFYGHKPRIFAHISDSSRNGDMLSEAKKTDLLRIKDIFDKHRTNYYIVISPNKDIKDISKADEAWMRKTFGTRFFDFVRPLAHLAIREDSYYDEFHYRPHIAKLIIDSIYK